MQAEKFRKKAPPQRNNIADDYIRNRSRPVKGMFLYKFKSTASLLYLLDILVHERLYCSQYIDLNDPFEGQFRTLVRSINLNLSEPVERRPGHVPLNLNQSVSRSRITYHDLRDLPYIVDTRVCSLTGDYRDVRMWSLYSDSHRGVAIEIDFTGIEQDAKEVHYVESLPKLGDTILGGPAVADVLTYKTVHWQYEDEYRIVSGQEHFDISGRIKNVLIGIRTESALVDLLNKLLPESVGIQRMRLDFDGNQIERGDWIREPIPSPQAV